MCLRSIFSYGVTPHYMPRKSWVFFLRLTRQMELLYLQRILLSFVLNTVLAGEQMTWCLLNRMEYALSFGALNVLPVVFIRA